MSSNRRMHSNTISGERPPVIDTSLRPTNLRRNSDGSPGLPPPIEISAPTPITPFSGNSVGILSLDHFPDRDQTQSEGAVSNDKTGIPPARIQSPLHTPEAAPETLPTLTLTPKPAVPSSRSRGSSTSTQHTIDAGSQLEKSDSQQLSVQRRPPGHRGSDATEDQGNVSDGGLSTTAGSVAGACGLDVANVKRNSDFHALFRSVPEDEMLIEDFGCALQKDILLQGRLYISENHLCFNANIFGWVTNLVIAFTDIVDIEKRTTAIFIPNAIQVSTLHAKHFFASFLSRDQAYDLMVDVWRYVRPIGHRHHRHDASVADDDQNSEASDSSDTSDGSFTDDSDMTDISGDEEDLDKTATHERQPSLTSLPLPEHGKTASAEALRRRAQSEAVRPNAAVLEHATKTAAPPPTPAKTAQDPAKPIEQVHEKTECGCSKNGGHFPNQVMDETYQGSLEIMYNLLYNSDFTHKFLTEDEKCLEVDMGNWQKGEGTVQYTRESSYIKPLNGSIGPKQTKCLLKDEVLEYDLQKCISLITTTQTPDVPSGSSFSVKTRVCFTWAGKSKVRMVVTVLVDFTKSSWLKSTIEKASIDGQQTHYKNLNAAIRKYITAHPGEFGVVVHKSRAEKHRVKRKRRHRKEEKVEAEKPKEVEPPKSALQRTVGCVATIAGNGLGWCIEHAAIPSTAQLSALCLVLMVIANIFIAVKMADVEHQLEQWSAKTVAPADGWAALANALQREPIRSEEKELWDWLSQLDPEAKTALMNQPTLSPEPLLSNDASKSKRKLDDHMEELAKMIERAQQNIDQVNHAVSQQREKMNADL
ncbi:uncharacterized protein BYT42DRAFT_544103 [Radiomyces spectabilis]|uniref:uncharacterized protein n=1 Tax=Radiomyces spectabilis TaxID=64574 RepID=UPI00221F3296|nr:uncharacterized protein BYT42DRAFT_544103 [Radiomyces spectabilis]KAI8388886.1 hypothetical protein BYT42DRAFT_544103 [Radiomyces spectabilis]